MAVGEAKSCHDTLGSYLDLVLYHLRSGGEISVEESRELFEIADRCGPESSGDNGDGIQFLYQQLIGIPNLVRPKGDLRDVVPGLLVTFFHPGDRVFTKEEGYFKRTSRNACLSFDEFVPRQAVCDEFEPTTLEQVPLRWAPGAEPWRVARPSGTPWRVLRPQLDAPTALDMIQRNMFLPDLVERAMAAYLYGASDPWETLERSYDVLDQIVPRHELTHETKAYYGEMISRIYDERIEPIKDQAWRSNFKYYYSVVYQHSFLPLVRSRDQIAGDWRGDFFENGWGMFVGVGLTLAGCGIGLPTLWTLGKMGLASLGFIAAVPIPSRFAIRVGVTLLSAAILVGIFGKSRSEAARIEKENYTQRIERPFPDVPDNMKEIAYGGRGRPRT